MLSNDRCVLTYGFNDEEVKKLKIYLTNVKTITNEMFEMKINDIIKGIKIENYSEKSFDEKIVLFNSYPEGEIRGCIKKLRETFPGIILAVVTPVSINWTFKYLMEHLLEEREMETKRGK